MNCQRESVTPSDDGTMTIDCSAHGEVAVVVTGGTIDQVAAGELDAVEAAWADHIATGA